MDKIIITIGREFGTGGRKIANCLGKMLNINIYDRRLLQAIQEKYNLTQEQIDKIKARQNNWWTEFKTFYNQVTSLLNQPLQDSAFKQPVTSEMLYKEEETILKTLAEQESCIILGRTGFHIFRNYPNAYKIFLTAPMPYRRDAVGRRLNINDGSADVLIKQVDEARENFTQTFSGKSRYDSRNYDLVINVEGFQPEQIAQIIAEFINQRHKK